MTWDFGTIIRHLKVPEHLMILTQSPVDGSVDALRLDGPLEGEIKNIDGARIHHWIRVEEPPVIGYRWIRS